MRGTVIKRGATYSVVIDKGRDPLTGKRVRVWSSGYPTKKAAEQKRTEMLRSLDTGTFVDPSKQTFGEYLEQWLAALPAQGLRSSTVTSYSRNLRVHVISRIGGATLQSLTAVHLDALYAELLRAGNRRGTTDRGLSNRSVRYVHTIISRALADATKKGLLQRNAAKAADPPSAKSAKAPEMAWWTPDQLGRFLAYVADDPLGPLFRLAGMTGMRRGEICGLHWGDVDLDRARLDVRWQLNTLDPEQQAPECQWCGVRHHRLAFGQYPKTDAGRRTIDLDAKTVTVLRAHRGRQLEQRLAVGAGWRDHDLVFALPNGDPVSVRSVSDIFMRRAVAAGVPPIRFHDLRHTHCAHLIGAKQDAKRISKRMGHSSVSFTYDRYGHLFEEAGSEAAAAVASLVDEG